ncbi:uncharacterized protein LOC110458589 [Mizuhopecten yessoensis]|uniref:Protein MB21D2 n=1 Tax=Mizuhopecten yessoensis TaxID=6573 RepID=A0A210Q6J5_MIZYE|nr:uncharacterized protein LOC110458589 [Mizuhopecten yessoensis]OWF44341.1 Protein MB21D2 [Mizuhopecten yessoensis]
MTSKMQGSICKYPLDDREARTRHAMMKKYSTKTVLEVEEQIKNLHANANHVRSVDVPHFTMEGVDMESYGYVPAEQDRVQDANMEAMYTGYHISKPPRDGRMCVNVLQIKVLKPKVQFGITEWAFGSVRKKVAHLISSDSLIEQKEETINATGVLISDTLDVLDTVGSLDLVKSRRTMDDMFYAVQNYRSHFSLAYIGSNAEGFRLPNSEIDMLIVPTGMKVFNSLKSLREYKRAKKEKPYHKYRRGYEDNELLYAMDSRNYEPGYTKVYGASLVQAVTEEFNQESWNIHEYFPTKHFIQICESLCRSDLPEYGQQSEGKHAVQKYNYTFCLHCETWPQEAEEWSKTRLKKRWPHPDLVTQILATGCHLVPTASGKHKEDPIQWRISFSTAEKLLIRSLSDIQFKVYALLRIMVGKIVDHRKEFMEILYPYVITTTILYLMDKIPPHQWVAEKCVIHFFKAIQCLINWIKKRRIPHYFIPKTNLFPTNIAENIVKPLLNTLTFLKATGIEFMLESSSKFMFGGRIRPCPEIDRLIVRGYIPYDGAGVELLQEIGEYKNMHYINQRSTSEIYLIFERAVQIFLSEDLSENEKDYVKYLVDNIQRSRATLLFKEYLEVKYLLNTLQQGELCLDIEREMLQISAMDVTSGRLSVSTYYYLQHKFVESLGMAQQAMELCDWFCMFVDNDGITNYFDNENCLEYDRMVNGKEIRLAERIIGVFAMKVPLWKNPKVLVPPELEFDLLFCTHPLGLFLSPIVYGRFMIFNSFFSLGHLKKARKSLEKLEATLEVEVQTHKAHVTLNMIACCRRKLGEYNKAFQRYKESYLRKPENDASVWHACVALYIYLVSQPTTVVIYTGPPPRRLLDLYTGPLHLEDWETVA